MSLVLSSPIQNGIWELKLNRVDKMNALSGALIQDALEALAQLRSRVASAELRVLLLTSASPKAFCVGADLGERMKMGVDDVPQALDHLRDLMDAIDQFPAPTIAVLEGMAFGGGMELALACDLRVCAPRCEMGLTETRLAIIPGAGGTQRLARLVGLPRAKEWIFTARRVQGAEAAAHGLVNFCVDNPRAKAVSLAEEICQAGPIAVVLAKRAIAGGWNLDLPSALDWERKCYLDLLHSEDRLEGLAAFVQKRTPRYQGK